MTELVVQKSGYDELMQLSDVFSKSKRFPSDTNPYQIAVKIQAGKELGLRPVQSLTNIHIVQGRITLGAMVIASLIKSSDKYDYRVKEHSNEVCSITILQDDEVIGESSFTMNDAKAAGLNNKDNWRKYPRNMLFSRALTNAARWYCPDVFGGPIYTPDELQDDNVFEENSDDLKDMSWNEFVDGIRENASNDVKEVDIKQYLKNRGYSWAANSKRMMWDDAVSNFSGNDIVDIDSDDITEIEMSDNV